MIRIQDILKGKYQSESAVDLELPCIVKSISYQASAVYERREEANSPFKYTSDTRRYRTIFSESEPNSSNPYITGDYKVSRRIDLKNLKNVHLPNLTITFQTTESANHSDLEDRMNRLEELVIIDREQPSGKRALLPFAIKPMALYHARKEPQSSKSIWKLISVGLPTLVQGSFVPGSEGERIFHGSLNLMDFRPFLNAENLKSHLNLDKVRDTMNSESNHETEGNNFSSHPDRSNTNRFSEN